MRTYTQKQRDFIRYYLETRDLIQSAIKAGYKSPEIGLHRKRLGIDIRPNWLLKTWVKKVIF